MFWSYSSLSYVLLQGFLLYMHHFPCCSSTLRDYASPWWKWTCFAPTWWGCLSDNPDDFDRNISSILQYLFFLGLYSISSILMLTSEFLPWVTDVSPSSTLHKKPNLNIKRSILFVFVRSWYVLYFLIGVYTLILSLLWLTGSNWFLYFDYTISL